MSECKVVSVINWKGGVGKTTLTHLLAAGLLDDNIKNYKKEENKTEEYKYPRILLIDLDAQCSLSISCLEADEFENKVYKNPNKILTIRDLIKKFLEDDAPSINIDDYILKKSVRSSPGYVYTFIDLIPSHQNLIYTDMYIANYDREIDNQIDDTSLIINKNAKISNGYKFKIINNIINKVRQNYDYIFIDCPPNLNFITQNALYASDYYIIPTILDRLSSYGILSITNAVKNLNKSFKELDANYNPTKLIGVIANNVREYAKEPKESQSNILGELNNSIGNLVFKSYITNGDGIPKSSSLGYPVFYLEDGHQNAAKQSEQIREIIKEMFSRGV